MFPKFLSIHKKTIVICIASLLLLTSCAVKAPTIDSPTISSEKAEELYVEAKELDTSHNSSSLDRAYRLYKQACFEGNHLESCLKLEKDALAHNTIIDLRKGTIKVNESEVPLKAIEYIAAIYNKQCQSGDYKGCLELAKLMKSKKYQNYFKESIKGGEKTLLYLIDTPLMIGTLGLYAILCPFDMCASTGFVANKVKNLKELTNEIENRAKQLLTQGCEQGNGANCFLVKEYKKGCYFYNLDSCSAYVKNTNNSRELVLKENTQLCDQKNAGGCMIASQIYLQKQDKKNAEDFSNKACQLGFNEACYFYADLQLQHNQNAGILTLKKMCDQQEALACEKVGDILFAHEDKKSISEATTFFAKSLAIKHTLQVQEKKYMAQKQVEQIDSFYATKNKCEEKKDTESCSNLAYAYLHGIPKVVKQDQNKALEIYVDLCKKDNNIGICTFVATTLQNEGKYAIAENIYKKINALNKKTQEHETPISELFERDRTHCNIELSVGIDQRNQYAFDSATSCYNKMCQEGYSNGCDMTHLMGREYLQEKNYSKRYPVRQDYFKAKETFEKNCKNGYGLSCIYLANMHFNGIGVKTDKAKAKEIREEGIKLLTKSCNFENGNDCTYLANETLDANPKKAFALYTKGCELGNSFACVQTGKMYEKGIGTAKNIGKAKDFYGKACDFQDQEGCSNYNRLSQ